MSEQLQAVLTYAANASPDDLARLHTYVTAGSVTLPKPLEIHVAGYNYVHVEGVGYILNGRESRCARLFNLCGSTIAKFDGINVVGYTMVATCNKITWTRDAVVVVLFLLEHGEHRRVNLMEYTRPDAYRTATYAMDTTAIYRKRVDPICTSRCWYENDTCTLESSRFTTHKVKIAHSTKAPVRTKTTYLHPMVRRVKCNRVTIYKFSDDSDVKFNMHTGVVTPAGSTLTIDSNGIYTFTVNSSTHKYRMIRAASWCDDTLVAVDVAEDCLDE